MLAKKKKTRLKKKPRSMPPAGVGDKLARNSPALPSRVSPALAPPIFFLNNLTKKIYHVFDEAVA